MPRLGRNAIQPIRLLHGDERLIRGSRGEGKGTRGEEGWVGRKP